MSMGERGWNDKAENYVDGWSKTINGTTATGINSSGDSPYLLQPIVVYSVSVSVNPAVGSGTVSLIDGTASADSGDERKVFFNIGSAAASVYEAHRSFPRGLYFDKGVIVSAAAITGSVSITYKSRYS